MAIERIATRACASTLAFAAALTLTGPARASTADAVMFVGVTALSGVASTAFTAYDIATAAEGAQPSRGMAIAEVAVAIPSTLAYGAMLIAVDYVSAEENDRYALAVPLLMLGTAGTGMLATHGIWSLATARTPPGLVMGGSLAIGADAAMTSVALASALQGRLSDRVAGITQVVLSVPQLIGASYQLATSPEAQNLWITVTAWSGALFVHGLASSIKGKLHHRDDDICPPQPPPPPEKPRLLVPASLQLGPVLVGDATARSPGLGIRGALW